MFYGSYLLYLNMNIENKVNMIINKNLKYIVIIKISLKLMATYKM